MGRHPHLQNFAAKPTSLQHLLKLRNELDSPIIRWLSAFNDDDLVRGPIGARLDLARLRRHDDAVTAGRGPRPRQQAQRQRASADAAAAPAAPARAVSPHCWFLVPLLRAALHYEPLTRKHLLGPAIAAANAVQADAWLQLRTAVECLRIRSPLYQNSHELKEDQVSNIFFKTTGSPRIDPRLQALLRTILERPHANA